MLASAFPTERLNLEVLVMNNVMTIDNSTLTSLEVAEMVGTSHKILLRKLDGRKDTKRPTKGYIQILTEHQLVPSDFFISSQYKDDSGKMNKCYLVTKKGCEFLAHKFTGEKGVIFTARYINRFHEMENELMNKEIPLLDDKKAHLIDNLLVDANEIPKVPLVENWYDRNIGRIERICMRVEITKKTLYHILLKRIGEKYNLDAAKEIYTGIFGAEPKYAMDIVAFFPELGEMADGLLDRIEKKIYS